MDCFDTRVLSPGEKVFAITELREAILLELNFDELLQCRTVSSGFLKTMASNKTLRQRLFLEPEPATQSQHQDPAHAPPPRPTGTYRINPLILQGLRRAYIRRLPGEQCAVYLPEPRITQLQAQMLLLQPPMRELELSREASYKQCCCLPRYDASDSEDPLRIAHLLRGVQSMLINKQLERTFCEDNVVFFGTAPRDTHIDVLRNTLVDVYSLWLGDVAMTPMELKEIEILRVSVSDDQCWSTLCE